MIDLRKRALDLCSWATYEGRGAPVDSERYRVVTEGRTLPGGAYSSCGDLVHWLLYSLGCRDRTLCNRGALGGWRIGQNLSLLDRHRELRRDDTPEPGDIVLLRGRYEHVAVVREWGEPYVVTYDYGQPGGEMRARIWDAPCTLGGCSVGWVLDLSRVPMVAPPASITSALAAPAASAV